MTRLSDRQIFWLLICGTAFVRVAMGWALGLGIDESYMVSAGRTLQLGYFDHPPLSWWLSSGIAHLTGSEAAWVVRLPFIALFAVSTALMWRLGTLLVSAEAGKWGAIAFNLAPVFGVTSGGWVLPDGPLDCTLLGMAVCLVHALRGRGLAWWLATGMLAGLALLSKYSAGLTLAGGFAYLLTQREHRGWLARGGPWLAVGICLLVFSPVVWWNATHGWASFAFQGGRAVAARLNLLGPFAALGGQSLFLLPWIWLGLVIAWAGAIRRGPSAWQGWLLACLAAPPIILFTLVALWSRNVLFHWAAPGYLFLFPLLGGRLVEWRNTRWIARAVPASFALVGTVLLALALAVRLNPIAFPNDPALQGIDWTPLKAALAERGLLNMAIAAPSWADTGKLDYALGGAPRVFCLNVDCRQYRFADDANRLLGMDVLIIAPRQSSSKLQQDYEHLFDRIETLPPVLLRIPGYAPRPFALIFGHRLRSWTY
jgi:4-amino-4-deoxy-L-arabinose transferase-like glycosyltransferase